jgi:hypothetical protein
MWELASPWLQEELLAAPDSQMLIELAAIFH